MWSAVWSGALCIGKSHSCIEPAGSMDRSLLGILSAPWPDAEEEAT